MQATGLHLHLQCSNLPALSVQVFALIVMWVIQPRVHTAHVCVWERQATAVSADTAPSPSWCLQTQHLTAPSPHWRLQTQHPARSGVCRHSAVSAPSHTHRADVCRHTAHIEAQVTAKEDAGHRGRRRGAGHRERRLRGAGHRKRRCGSPRK